MRLWAFEGVVEYHGESAHAQVQTDQKRFSVRMDKGSLGVRNEIKDSVGTAFNPEIKSPIISYSGLPSIVSFTKLFCMQGRVLQVANEEVELLDEGLLNRERRGGQCLHRATRQEHVHRGFFTALARVR